MNEYRILVPIGAQLPQAEKLVQVTEKSDDGKQNTLMVMVSSIRRVTWGTKGNTDQVAGVFVDFWGAPWPPVILPEDLKRRKRKHIVAYDVATGVSHACFNSDDVLEEVPSGSCPHCAKMERLKEAQATQERSVDN